MKLQSFTLFQSYLPANTVTIKHDNAKEHFDYHKPRSTEFSTGFNFKFSNPTP
jgi:hypothetical protein